MNDNRVLLIGWDGADWKVIHRLLDAGLMPNLSRLVNEGVIGDLATLYPPLSPMLWTSIATGKHAFKHGILGFTEPAPDGGARPVSSRSRQTKALWNIVSQEGACSVAIGWWPSQPVEPIRGAMVSNHFHSVPKVPPAAWKVPAGSVHPEAITSQLAELRWHPGSLTGEHILNFVPLAAEVDQKKDRRLATIAKLACECTTVYEVAHALLRDVPWRLAAVYFDAIDHFSHGFMTYRPPRLPQVSEADERLYGGVVDAAYCYHDLLLGRLLEQVGRDVHVMLISDHGFHSDHLRPVTIPVEPAGPAVQHRGHGIFVLRGPGVKQDERIHGASLLDICPTILAMLGLPVGRDMDGRPLAQAFVKPLVFEMIDSWDTRPGDARCLPAEAESDPAAEQEAMKQLVELGYIEPQPKNRALAGQRARREWSYNLAQSYMGAARSRDALPLLEVLAQENPAEFRFGTLLAEALLGEERIDEAQAVVERLEQSRAACVQKANTQLEALRVRREEALKGMDPDKPRRLRPQMQERLRRLHAAANPNSGGFLLLKARILMARGMDAEALAILGELRGLAPSHTGLMIHTGQLLLKLRRWREAEVAFTAILAKDPNVPAAFVGLGHALLAQRCNLRAAAAALSAIGLQYDHPHAHYLLGVALQRTRHIERAVEAFRVAVALHPAFPDAYERLEKIYTRRLKDPAAAASCKQLAAAARAQLAALRAGRLQPQPLPAVETVLSPAAQRPIPPAGPLTDRATRTIIVSGLPRSGTSLLMQMLAAGGLPIYSDGARRPDESNPRGYFETEKAKALVRDARWLGEARGKAVKIVSPLIRFLPADPQACAVILMERDLGEILASQKKMLQRLDKPGPVVPDARLQKAFEAQAHQALSFLAQHHIPCLVVRHEDCLQDAGAVAQAVSHFLGGGLDLAQMSTVVDPSLHRERRG